MTQSATARLPKFRLVANELRHRILTGQLLVGEKLPPAKELSRSFKVSPVTVLRGVQQLAREGLVSSNSNPKGTVVINTTIRPPVHQATLACLFRPCYGRNGIDDYGIDIMESIRGEISRREYRFIHHALDERGYERRVTEVVQHGGACGIVMDQKTPDSVVRRLCGLGVPGVMYNRVLSTPNLSCASPDFESVGRKSARMFRGKGYQRVGFYCMPPDEAIWSERRVAERDQLIRQRRSFFEEAEACGFAREDMAPLPEIVVREMRREPEGYGLPRRKPNDWRPLGILTVSDDHAVRLMEAVAKTDLILGRDIGVIAGIELDVSQKVARPSSTWRTDRGAIGSTAVSLLLDRIENPQLLPSTATIALEFVDHETA